MEKSFRTPKWRVPFWLDNKALAANIIGTFPLISSGGALLLYTKYRNLIPANTMTSLFANYVKIRVITPQSRGALFKRDLLHMLSLLCIWRHSLQKRSDLTPFFDSVPLIYKHRHLEKPLQTKPHCPEKMAIGGLQWKSRAVILILTTVQVIANRTTAISAPAVVLLARDLALLAERAGQGTKHSGHS